MQLTTTQWFFIYSGKCIFDLCKFDYGQTSVLGRHQYLF